MNILQDAENLKWIDDLAENDFVIIDDFVDTKTLNTIKQFFKQKENEEVFQKAAIGPGGNEKIINEVRGDYTYWLSKQQHHELGDLFDTIDHVKSCLNRYCFLSLSDYEFHLAHYPKGSFYKKHLDQFEGRNNRLISMIIYLNENWKQGDGGELRVYNDEKKHFDIAPLENRCVIFKSDKLVHEVLMANKERRSITGWMLHQPSVLATIV